MPTTPHATDNAAQPTRWAVQRQIDARYFDGDGWTHEPVGAYRTSDRSEAANLAAYLVRITPGWVRAVVISD